MKATKTGFSVPTSISSGAPVKKGFVLAKPSAAVTPAAEKSSGGGSGVAKCAKSSGKGDRVAKSAESTVKKLSKKVVTQKQKTEKKAKACKLSFPNLPKGPKNAYMHFVEETRAGSY
jgi:hypothetical protein